MSDVQPPAGQGFVAVRPAQTVRSRLKPLLAVPTPLIFVAAATLAMALLWRQGSLEDVRASLAAVSPIHILAVLVAYATSIMLLGLRWHVLVRLAGARPAWPSSSEVFLTSVIVNYAAPIGLAVPTRAALTVRDLGLSPVQSGIVVGWELGLDVAALLAITVAWLVIGGSSLLQTVDVDATVVAMLVALAILSVVLAGGALSSQRLRGALARLARQVVSEPIRHPALVLAAISLTLVFWVTQLGVMGALLDAFGVVPAPPLVFGLMGLPVLVGMLSPVPGGAGVRETLMAAVAGLAQAPAAPIVVAAVTYRLALFVVTPLVWGVVRLIKPRVVGT